MQVGGGGSGGSKQPLVPVAFYGSTTGVESQSGSRKYLARDMSMQSLAMGNPGGHGSGELLHCDGGSGSVGRCGVPVEGGGASRVKAVRTSLAYTLLQRLLR